jgi:erythronate-4-phosphate dehydrogenase
MLKVIADDKIPFLKGVLEPYSDITYLPGRLISKEHLKDCDALIIRTITKCTNELLDGTNVSFIGTATIGFDHIDSRYCEEKGIKWTNAPGCNSSSVQQYITAALLKLSADFHFSLKGKTLGIIGVGNVGAKVEKIARIFGMNVLLNDPPRARQEGNANFTDLNTILQESDIITLHVPLNYVGEDKTHHMFDDRAFRKMKNGAWLINSSRGEVVQTSALKKAIRFVRFGGCILDVWEDEPDIDLELLEKVFIGTPHIAGYSTDGKVNGTSNIINELSYVFDLPLKNWRPAVIPQPHDPEIDIDANGKSDEDVAREAVFHSYNIVEDDTNLRFAPYEFEKLRGNYRTRREFTSFTVNLKNPNRDSEKMLTGLGFTVVPE